MKNTDIIIAHPLNETKSEALKSIMIAMKIKFEVKKKSNYKTKLLTNILNEDFSHKNEINNQINNDLVTMPTSNKTMKDFWGIISNETAQELQKSVNESRSEWEERFNQQF